MQQYYGSGKIILLSLFFLTVFLILGSSQVVSDPVYYQLPATENGESSSQVDGSAQYQIQNYVREENSNGRRLYVSRPFGYLECNGDSNVNLSIIKTYIDWVSEDEAYIRGEIKNQDDKTIDIIVLTFNLFNANGYQIGNAYATIDYLEPKSTWKFSTDPIKNPEFKFDRFGSIFTGVYL